MTYGPDEASHDLTLIRQSTASFEVRVRLEHFLLKGPKRTGERCGGSSPSFTS
jgi:hypothetical protein